LVRIFLASLHSEDGSSMALRNVDVPAQRRMTAFMHITQRFQLIKSCVRALLAQMRVYFKLRDYVITVQALEAIFAETEKQSMT
jgi:hypothetical protein